MTTLLKRIGTLVVCIFVCTTMFAQEKSVASTDQNVIESIQTIESIDVTSEKKICASKQDPADEDVKKILEEAEEIEEKEQESNSEEDKKS